jgi:hypothetical protein
MLGLLRIGLVLLQDTLHWVALLFGPPEAIRADSRFARRQPSPCLERGAIARRIDPATRVSLTLLPHQFDWRSAPLIVKPETLLIRTSVHVETNNPRPPRQASQPFAV